MQIKDIKFGLSGRFFDCFRSGPDVPCTVIVRGYLETSQTGNTVKILVQIMAFRRSIEGIVPCGSQRCR